MKETKKEKLAKYIKEKGYKESYSNLVNSRFYDLCEIVEFSLKENIFDVLDKLNIKYDIKLRG